MLHRKAIVKMPDEMQVVSEWEVELAISGAITLGRKSFRLPVEKGEQDPFTTTVTISKADQGCHCKLIARAYTEENANDVTVYFVGQALDVLSLELDLPLYLNLFQPKFRSVSSHVRRVVTEEEWLEAFTRGRDFSINRRHFSRAIGWYRKGLVSDDPIDRLLAFWSALESIGSVYFRPTSRTENRIINQVCDCFDQIWGSVERWLVIPNQPRVVNSFHDFRNGFSHGFKRVDINTVREVSKELPVFQELTHEFLLQWMEDGEQFEQAKANRENHALDVTFGTAVKRNKMR